MTRILRDPLPEAAGMTLGELLMAQHRWGHTRSRRVLAALELSEAKTVGSLTERQRDALLRRLGVA